jgi:hypothetical protein
MNPFGDQPVTQPLPCLHQPAIALFHVGLKKFLLLFGGRNKETLSRDLIAVNLDELTWFIVQVEGASVLPRQSSSMVVIDNRLFIFGGIGLSGRRDNEILNSYCVAEYSNHDTKWRWIVRDEQYPDHIPSLGQDSRAISVYGGKKILLTAGRDSDLDVSLNPMCSQISTYFFQI